MRYGITYKHKDGKYTTSTYNCTDINQVIVGIRYQLLKFIDPNSVEYVIVVRKSYSWTYTVRALQNGSVDLQRVHDLDHTIHNKKPAMTMRRAKILSMKELTTCTK